jgi:hypothetical protein
MPLEVVAFSLLILGMVAWVFADPRSWRVRGTNPLDEFSESELAELENLLWSPPQQHVLLLRLQGVVSGELLKRKALSTKSVATFDYR